MRKDQPELRTRDIIKKKYYLVNFLYFMTGALVFGLIGYFIVSDFFSLTVKLNLLILQIIIILLFNGLVLFGWTFGDKTEISYYNRIGIFFIILFTSIIHIDTIPFRNYLYWINLILWIILGWYKIKSELEKERVRFLTYLSGAWLMTSAYITIGNGLIYNYSKEPLNNLVYIHRILDIRFSLGIILTILFLIKSVLLALEHDEPDIVKIPIIEMEDLGVNNNTIKSILKPFIFVINTFIIGVINTFWIIIAIIFIYFYRIGKEFTLLLLKIISNSFYIFILIGIMIIILIAADKSGYMSYPLLKYLKASSITTSHEYLLNVLLYVIILILCLLGTAILNSIQVKEKKISINIENFKKNIDSKAFGLFSIALMLWLSGSILFLLSQIKGLQFLKFTQIGLFSLVLSIIVIMGAIAMLANKIIQKRK